MQTSKEKLKEAQKRYVEKNPEKVKEAQRKWNEKNIGYNKEWYQKTRDQNREKDILRYRKMKKEQPWILAYRAVKTRAKKKNMEFNLTEDYLMSIWSLTCPVLGIPLYPAVYESGNSRTGSKAKPHDNSPTIDRIDSSKGYIIGNVCIMSYRANMIKNCGTIDEHRAIVRFLENQAP
jgi:hypothetical protein